MRLGGKASYRFVMGKLGLIEPTLSQGQGISVFVELGLRSELAGSKLSRPVIGLLRQSQVGGGSVDFTLALATISGRGPTVMRCSSASPTILSASVRRNSATSSGLSTTSRVAPWVT
jgi:hypothetical protein